MDIRSTFKGGIMNKDDDDRTLPQDQHRDALNIHISHSEGSDVGAGEKIYGNEKLTSIDLGENVLEIGKYEDEPEDKLYWFTKSELGCFLLEWDNINQVVSIILKDTRPEDNGRVLNLKETHLITGIQKVISENTKDDLLVWTDDNIEVCCINIERAKTWGENGFTKEDIYLVKKPPRYALKAIPSYSNDGSNNMEDKFPAFFYKYKYRDGEYSALSDPTNYKFTPKAFDLDYFTLENKGMINAFNAVRLTFNTGEEQVTDIQICVKFSNSLNIYIIESFNKNDKGWSDNEENSHVFSNSKLYSVLPEKELYRSFDNVPKKAKALTLIENKIVIGNYEEGMDIIDNTGTPINIDYSVLLLSTYIESNVDFDLSFFDKYFSFQNATNETLVEGKQLYFSFNIALEGTNIYKNSFLFILDKKYSNLNELVESYEFQEFVSIVNKDFILNYNNSSEYEIDPNYALKEDTYIEFRLINNIPTFNVEPIYYTDTGNLDSEVRLDTTFEIDSYVGIGSTDSSTSCKSNMGYEVAIEYQDEFNRRVPVLTSETNTLFIPQKHSDFKNQLRVVINNKAPKDADRYKICVKSKPLQYQIIYINEFYNEDSFVWIKLVAENKDKVSIGDELILKKAGEIIISEPITIKVLDKKEKDSNFIIGNTDENENEIIETEGSYIKIRPPNGVSMDLDDFDIYQNDTRDSSGAFPKAYLDLFTEIDEDNANQRTELKIKPGSSIYLYINSNRVYDSGRRTAIYEKTLYAQRDYDTIQEWFEEIILNGNSIPAPIEGRDDVEDYKDNLELVRGSVDGGFEEDINGKLYLKITGLYSGGSKDRDGYCQAQIVIRTSTGFYAFETNPKQAEQEIFYQTEQCFDIVNGNHLSNNQDQNTDTFTPAIVDLNFFNCYSHGNGVESYKYKDGFNTNYLNIDLRPSTTSLGKPRKIRRFADLTYGESFTESSGINGLNEFNLSTGNYKELDKQYSSVQRLFSRNTDLLVWQEDKVSKVLFGKDLIKTANGESVISSVPEILGQQIPYAGENGIGIHPESLAWNDFRFYYVNSKKGTAIRLSIDGVTKINNKMVDYFRDLFINNPTSKKIGGYNPYHNLYVLHNTDEIIESYNVYCGNSLYKTITEPFSYYLNLNSLVGDIILNYNILEGEASIAAEYKNQEYQVLNITEQGTLTIPRTTATSNEKVLITVTPNTNPTVIELSNVCPIGVNMNLYTIVLVDEVDLDRTVTNRFRWGLSSFYSNNQIFEISEINTFKKETGLEGVNKFPQRNNIVNIQSYKDVSDTFLFDDEKGNKLGYLISDTEYNESDIDTILDNATFLQTTETQIAENSFVNQGSFDFIRPSDSHNLYLIYDYRSSI